MGRRRHKRNSSQQVDTTEMIEHTIQVTKPSAVVQQQRPSIIQNIMQGPNSYHMSYDELLTYQKKLEAKGYKIGARVSTNYGMKGYIHSFRSFHINGITQLNNTKPSVMYVHYDGVQEPSTVLYSETELTPL